MKTNELREIYLSFFESKGCVRRPSDVLVPKWDPSVLFTPAGMNPFKDHFLGRCRLDFTRATSCQKCLRTGDIDNVGRTAFHHTFFEMLGNFSFGDYFKREAILWAWEFLTSKKWLGIEPSKLSATVYKYDHEAAKIWLEEVKIPAARLQYLDEDENFWPASSPSQGPDGVCGPCSEIYHDTPTGTVEIWNLVFTQFNRVGEPPNNLQPLPSKNIDTGMGLERCAAVLQGVDTNYHIDILRPLVEAAAAACHVEYDPTSENGRRLRRIADHIRACTFAVHENVYPGSKEEKYVIRRLLRRAVLDGRQMGCTEPFLHQLVPVVAELMAVPYPELSETTQRVANVITAEEENFSSTIDSGLDKIEKVFEAMRNSRTKTAIKTIPGVEAFEMYQTYGFPPELFQTMAAEHNFGFDWDGFQKEMERHGEISGGGEKNLLFKHDVLEAVKKEHHGCHFDGYDKTYTTGATVLAIVSNEVLVDQLDTPQTETTCDSIEKTGHYDGVPSPFPAAMKTPISPVRLLLDKTTFYGERGGQVGDTGKIVGPTFTFEVSDTQVDGDFVIHIGQLTDGTVTLGDIADTHVNVVRRNGIARAHTATHLLHYVLRNTLGSHAEQQGSKVDCDILRFDFTNHEAVDREILQKMETEVNRLILTDSEVVSREMILEDARKTGAMMLFGEKYPDTVRVVTSEDSKELCGGIHLENTAKVGLFKIVSEESVSSGVRRITAVTGLAALARVQKTESFLQQTAMIFKSPQEEVPKRAEAMMEQVKRAKKQLEVAAKEQKISIDDLLAGAQEIGNTKVLLWTLPLGNDAGAVRQLVDQLRRKTPSFAAMFVAPQEENKVLLIAALSNDLCGKKLSAVDWVKEVSPVLGGSGGGGRPDMAQAGGKSVADAPLALTAAKKWLDERL